MFASRVFIGAGIYGLLCLTPLYFLEDRIGRETPPPVTHPEYYYGFIGVTLAWQIAFLMIGSDPVRYRPLMLAAMAEKITFVAAVALLFAGGRVATGPVLGASVDLLLLLLFAAAFVRTPRT